VISAGPISKLLSRAQEQFREEKQAMVECGLRSSAWQHIDDTGTRVDGENQHCEGICHPLSTAYCTTARKDRLTGIDAERT